MAKTAKKTTDAILERAKAEAAGSGVDTLTITYDGDVKLSVELPTPDVMRGLQGLRPELTASQIAKLPMELRCIKTLVVSYT